MEQFVRSILRIINGQAMDRRILMTRVTLSPVTSSSPVALVMSSRYYMAVAHGSGHPQPPLARRLSLHKPQAQ